MIRLLSTYLCILSCVGALATDFDDLFCDQTIRYDIKVAAHGPDKGLSIDRVMMWDGWWGRRVNMERAMYRAALTYAVIDEASGDSIYVDSKYLAPEGHRPVFSTFVVPVPRQSAKLSVTAWWDDSGVYHPWQTIVVPVDTNIAKTETHAPFRMLHEARDPKHAVTIAIVGDGYTHDEMGKFILDATRVDSALFTHPGYGICADCINTVAVMLESPESGISRPSRGLRVRSALGAHFDSFALDRLITIPDVRPLWDALVGVPAQQIMILANTPEYGGSGPYNDYAIASSDNPWSMYTIVHEFGHTFVNLGDEYEDGYDIFYGPEIEPDEPNITTMCDFDSKWADMIKNGTARLIEGAGYQSKGVYRAFPNCLMRSLADRHFCPVCTRAIVRTINFYTRPIVCHH